MRLLVLRVTEVWMSVITTAVCSCDRYRDRLRQSLVNKYGCVFCSQVWKSASGEQHFLSALTFPRMCNDAERKTNSWIEISVGMDHCVGSGWRLMREWETRALMETNGDREWERPRERTHDRHRCVLFNASHTWVGINKGMTASQMTVHVEPHLSPSTGVVYSDVRVFPFYWKDAALHKKGIESKMCFWQMQSNRIKQKNAKSFLVLLLKKSIWRIY